MATKKILITGDYVIDHHILKGNKSEAFGNKNAENKTIGTLFKNTAGGARLTFDLFADFQKKNSQNKKENFIKCSCDLKEINEIQLSQGTINDSYLRWFIEEVKSDNKASLCLKLVETLGFGSQKSEIKPIDFYSFAKNNTKDYNTIVIDEAAINFRDYNKLWPDFSKADKIILKTTYPLCTGLLWDELVKHREKLITIVNHTQIKHYNIKVSSNISWEQTALDIVYGIHQNKTLQNLLKSGELIILIGTAGAIHIKSNEKQENNEYRLIFDPQNMENEWEEINSNNIVNTIGLGSSFLAGYLAASYMLKGLKPHECIKIGLNTMTSAMVNGIFSLSKDFNISINTDLVKAISEKICNRNYSSAFIPSPAWKKGLDYIHNQEWTILENNYDNYKSGYVQKKDLFPLAFSLVKNEVTNIKYAPLLSFGKVNTLDRFEIENIRNIRKQVDFYDKFENGKKPLNIAVFGPPGAGKSFIVKEMANNMFKGKKTKPVFLTFNLSQFKDETELPGAFHTIRDEVLRGNLPIVFWDEFDSDNYKWLKSLIAPMQDGEFQEGKEIHPIGKSIFVFAGGMTYTMDHFNENMEKEDLINKKGPDFLSRINCSLNVFGPNPKPHYENGKWIKEGDKKDICYSIRRALFILQILSSDNKKINIEDQLLRALVEVSNYKNGSRGLDRLLKNLAIHKDRKIELSDLPSKEILKMNVNYDSFMENLENEELLRNIDYEKIAIAIHNSWLNFKVKDSAYFETYEDLNYDGRMVNISAARRIGDIIETTNKFEIISVQELKSKQLKDAKVEFDEFLKNTDELDKLAEKEHNAWMKEREDAKWNLGERSDYLKFHPCMVSFNELDKGVEDRTEQEQKNKDRNSILNYSKILEENAYTITFIDKK